MSHLSLSPPQGQYRTALYSLWVKKLMMHHIPHTSEPTLIGTLGNPVKIRSWQVPASGGWSDWTGPVAWSELGQEPPASLPPLSWVCSEMPLWNPPGPSKRVWVGEEKAEWSGAQMLPNCGQRDQGVLEE